MNRKISIEELEVKSGVKFPFFAGLGNRMVVADSVGQLSAMTISGTSSNPDWTVVKKDATSGRFNTTTLSADPHLSVSLQSGYTYNIRMVIYYNSGPGGIKIGYSGPSSFMRVSRDNTILGNYSSYSILTDWDAAGVNITTQGLGKFTMEMMISTNAAGTLALTWAQALTHATESNVEKGSYMEVMEELTVA